MAPLPAALIRTLAPVAPGAMGTPWGAAGARDSYGDGRLAGEGMEGGTPRDQGPLGAEPGHMGWLVSAADAAGVAPPRFCAPRGDTYPGGRRHRGRPPRSQERGAGLRSRGGARPQAA
jgi:hypothetical protein